MRWNVALLAAVLGFAQACSSISCPEGRVAENEACRCPDGQTEREGRCVELPAEPNGVTRSPSDASSPLPPSDAGTSGSTGANGGSTGTDGRSMGADGDSTSTGGNAGDSSRTNDAGARPPVSTTSTTTSDGPTAPPPPDSGGRVTSQPTTSSGAPICGNGIQETGEECDDGNDYIFDRCAGCKRPQCGDGVINGDEECEVGVFMWTARNCAPSSCVRTIFVPCNGGDDCLRVGPGSICSPASKYCTPLVCDVGECGEMITPSCPGFPGASEHHGGFCFLFCESWQAPCPRGLRCAETRDGSHMCVGPGAPGFDTGTGAIGL